MAEGLVSAALQEETLAPQDNRLGSQSLPLHGPINRFDHRSRLCYNESGWIEN